MSVCFLGRASAEGRGECCLMRVGCTNPCDDRSFRTDIRFIKKSLADTARVPARNKSQQTDRKERRGLNEKETRHA